ncbi:MAG TPA: peptidoglycan DD-metalloendopeptidase family protein [Spirochaetota bacterium]|nr:peptidoglycan DD-metalloendopeptidase family protein [Spirochaetota bacterium]HOL58096.1 peptidoglycan DD-metalloendopeptidase family protein [Spirochaetota bacterium]HPP05172.1 peptidoglycan DD-metalloendopeptidase family protein [Spirochaetota bacterium]
MNKINNFKKIEKSLFVWFVNLFSIIKRFFLSIINFFLNAGNQKVTVMLIPHSEKKVFNFRVNVFILFLFFFFLFSTLGIISFLTIANFKKSIDYNNLSLKTMLNENRAREYEELINDILDNHRILKGKLNLLLTKIDSSIIKDSDQGKGGISNIVDTTSLTEFEQEKIEVKKLLDDYQYSIQAFNEINKMVDNYNRILKDMPYGSPVLGFYSVTSTFGFRIHPIYKVLDMHTGIDLAYQPGTPIVATAPGIVDKVDYDGGGYGWYLKIQHTKGFSTLYAHLRSQPIVRPGDKVRKGQIIGYMGSTGMSTGTHVHYEVRLGNNLLDPWQFINN